MYLTALEICKEASLRLGITPPPTTIEFQWTQENNFTDPVAVNLASSLKQAAAGLTAAADWHQLARIGTVGLTESTYRFLLDDTVTEGYHFDKILSKVIYVLKTDIETSESLGKTEMGLLTYEDFIQQRFFKDDGLFDGFVNCIINGNYIELTESVPSGQNWQLNFFYKIKDTTGNKMVFDEDTDILYLDDEMLILGTMINYKARIHEDNSYEVTLYKELLDHEKDRLGSTDIMQVQKEEIAALKKQVQEQSQKQQQQQQQQQQKGQQ